MDRRNFVSFIPAVAVGIGTSAAAASNTKADFERRMARIETMVQGRLGVQVLDSADGSQYGWRADERFMLLSSFKLLACAFVLNRVDGKEEELNRRIHYGRDVLIDYSPVTERQVDAGGLTLGQLCEATLTTSDNTAANLILESYGGPAALTAFLRRLGDPVTRLDRTEPNLNIAAATTREPLDTTTPRAMVRTMQLLLTGDALSAASRAQILRWMLANQTGGKRLRAGVPPDWRVGDKTGTNGLSANDVAIVWPPANREPLLVAAYIEAAQAGRGASERGLADVGTWLSELVNVRP